MGSVRKGIIMIKQRSIAVCIILSIVTFGIYGIYWLICLNDETNQVSGDQSAPSGGIVFLLTLVTCGIYGLYWNYKQGEKLDAVCAAVGWPQSSRALVYLLLSVFGLSIISYALMQDTLNKLAPLNPGAGYYTRPQGPTY